MVSTQPKGPAGRPARGLTAPDAAPPVAPGKRARATTSAVLLVALLPATLLAPLRDSTPGTWWPAGGLAAIALLTAPRRWQWALLAAMVAVTAPVLTVVYGAALPVAALGTSVIVGPALVAATLLRPRTAGRAGGADGRLRDFATTRYHLVVLGTTLVCGLLVALVTAREYGTAQVVQLTVAAALGSLTSLLVTLPLVASTTARPALAGPVELRLQRTTLVLVSLLLLLLPVPQALCTAVFPVLGWAALRASRAETMRQLFGFAVAAYVATVFDLGVMSTSPGPDVPAVLQAVPLHLFLASLAYLIVPLTLAVERLSVARATAVRNATAVERMLDGTTTTLLIVTDGDGRITRFNEGARRILGYCPEDVLGRPATMLHRPEEIARHASQLRTADDLRSVVDRQVQLTERRDWEFLRTDDTTCIVSLGFTVVHDPDHSVALVVASGEDVTERLREREVMQTALAREHQSVLRLQEVDHVKQELVSNVSHELRTPITSIAGYAELLADSSLGELTRAQHDALQRIERNAQRLQGLVDDLLTLSRSESGQLQLSRTALDLREVVRSAWELFDEQLRHRDLETALVLPGQPVPVVGDGRALERVVVNLVGNAVKFTRDGGSVRVTVTRGADGSARLTVQDTGIGIHSDDQDQLFTRFFRARQATDQAIQGTGLGLSIVHALVSQHGGQVGLRSRPGEGTRVTVQIPPS